MSLNLGSAVAVIDLDISGIVSKARQAASALQSLDSTKLSGPDVSGFGKIVAQAQTAARSVSNAFDEITLQFPDADLSPLADAVAQAQESAASVGDAFQGIDLATPPVDAGSLAEAATEAASAAGSVQAAFDQQTLATPTVDTSSLAQAEAAGDAAAQHIQSSFDAINLAVGAAPAGAFGLATKGAIDFGAAMANVNSIAQLDQGTLQTLSTQVEALAVQLGRSPTDLAEGLYNVYSVGFQGADAMNILALAAKDANAGLSSTETTTGLLTGVLLSYGMSVDDAAHVSDVLFQEVNDGANSFEGLAHNMAQTVPLASSMGVSIEELSAAYALMTSRGIPVAQTETDIAALMRAGLSPTKAMTQALNEHGYSSVQDIIATKGLTGYLQFLQDASGGTAEGMYKLLGTQEGVAAALTLTKGGVKSYSDELNKMIHASDGAGATNRALAKQMEATKFHLQRLGAAFDVFKISIGAAFEPFIKAAADFGVTAINAFLALPGPIRTVISLVSGGAAGFLGLATSVALFGGKVAEVLNVAKGMAGAMKLLTLSEEGAVLGLGPLGVAILGIAAAAAIFYAAYKTNFLGFGDLVDGVIGKVKKFVDVFRETFDMALFAGANPVAAFLNAIGNALASLHIGPLTTLGDGFIKLASDVNKFAAAFKAAFDFSTLMGANPVAAFLAGIGNGLESLNIAPLTKLGEAFLKLASYVQKFSVAFQNAFFFGKLQGLNPAAAFLRAIGAGLKALNIAPLAALGDAFQSVAGVVQHVTNAIGDAFKGNWAGSFKELKLGVQNLGKAFNTLGALGSDAIAKLGSLLQKGVGGAMDALSRRFPAFNGLWDRFRGIGQGVGGVIKNLGQALGDLFRGNFGSAFQNLGQAGIDGLKAIGNAMGTLPSLLAGVFKSINWGGVGSALEDGLGAAAGLAFQGLSAAQGAFRRGWDGLTNALQNFSWQGLGNALQAGIQTASSLAFAGLNAAGGAIAGLWDWITNAASNIPWGDIANTITGGAAGAVAGLAGSIAGAAGDLWGWITGTVSTIDWTTIGTTLFNAAKDVVGDIATGFEDGAGVVWTWLQGLAGKVKDAVGNGADWLKSTGSDIIQGLWDGMKSVWDSLLGWFEGALNDLIALVNKVIDVVNKLSKVTGVHIDPIPYIGLKQTLLDLGKGYTSAAKSATDFAQAQAAAGKAAAQTAATAFNAAFPKPGARSDQPAPPDATTNIKVPGATPVIDGKIIDFYRKLGDQLNIVALVAATAAEHLALVNNPRTPVAPGQGKYAALSSELSGLAVAADATRNALGPVQTALGEAGLSGAATAASVAVQGMGAGLGTALAGLGNVATQTDRGATGFTGMGAAAVNAAGGVGSFAVNAATGAAGAAALGTQLTLTQQTATALAGTKVNVAINGDATGATAAAAAAAGAVGAVNGLTAPTFEIGDSSNAEGAAASAAGAVGAVMGLTANTYELGDSSGAEIAASVAAGAVRAVDGATGRVFVQGDNSGAMAAIGAAAAYNGVTLATAYIRIETMSAVSVGSMLAGLANGGVVGYANGGRIKGYAGGGLLGGSVVMVGERGPELAYLPNGTYIQPHGPSMAAMRRNRGGTVINNYYALRSDEYAALIENAQAGGDMARSYSNPTRTSGYLRGR